MAHGRPKSDSNVYFQLLDHIFYLENSLIYLIFSKVTFGHYFTLHQRTVNLKYYKLAALSVIKVLCIPHSGHGFTENGPR